MSVIQRVFIWGGTNAFVVVLLRGSNTVNRCWERKESHSTVPRQGVGLWFTLVLGSDARPEVTPCDVFVATSRTNRQTHCCVFSLISVDRVHGPDAGPVPSLQESVSSTSGHSRFSISLITGVSINLVNHPFA